METSGVRDGDSLAATCPTQVALTTEEARRADQLNRSRQHGEERPRDHRWWWWWWLERVEYHWTFTGTNTGPGGTGNAVRVSGFGEWTIDDDGLIAASVGHYDAAASPVAILPSGRQRTPVDRNPWVG